jgi:hypothetical protein
MSIWGIMDGCSDSTFRLDFNLTRAQAVKVLNRLFNREPILGNIDPTFKDVPADHWAFKEIETAAR